MKTIIKKGESFRKVIRMKYADSGIPVDLSECTAFSQMRTEPGGMLIETGACTIEADRVFRHKTFEILLKHLMCEHSHIAQQLLSLAFSKAILGGAVVIVWQVWNIGERVALL